jgi:hypothetical protein
VEIAIYNRYRRGRVANAEPLARADVHLIARRDHPMARRRELAVRSFAEIPLAMPVRPNSLTSVLTGLAASQHFELDIRLEAGSTPLIRDVMLASDLATISPRHLSPPCLHARDRGGRACRHSHCAAENRSDHMDVAEFTPPTIRRGRDRGASHSSARRTATRGEVARSGWMPQPEELAHLRPIAIGRQRPQMANTQTTRIVARVAMPEMVQPAK